MSRIGQHALGAALFQSAGRLAQGVGGVDHVVDDQAGAAGHVADDVHHFGHIGLGAALVDDGQIGVQGLGHRAGADHAADVRADHDQVFDALRADVLQQHRRRVDVVHRDVEETLNLVGVQVDGEHAVDAGAGQHIGHQLGGNRHAGGTRTTVLARITEVRNCRGNTTGRSAFQRVGHSQDFHQIVIGRRTGRLQNEHVASADVFQQLHRHFAVAELADVGASQRDIQMFDYVLGQFRVRGPGEYHQTVVCRHDSCALAR